MQIKPIGAIFFFFNRVVTKKWRLTIKISKSDEVKTINLQLNMINNPIVINKYKIYII